MSLFTTIKVEFESHLRRLAFDSDSSSWTAVRSQILTSYGVSVADGQNYVLHYLDDEGDLISVNSDTEFAEAMRCAKLKSKILKLTLSKSTKSSSNNTESPKQARQSPQQDEKTPLINVTVSSASEEAEVDVENVNDIDVDVDDAADQQVEEMDLPLSRRDLLSKSPTLSEASDSSFVSINAQSLRDDLDAKDELAVEGVNDSELLNTHAQAQAQAARLEDDAKAAVGPSKGASNPATPSQPEFISTDRAVVQDVLKQLAADPIQLKSSATPKATTPTTINNTPLDEKEKEEQVPTLQIPAQTESGKDEAKVQVHDVVVAAPLPCASSPCASSVPLMKVKELRSVIEGVVQEKMPEWVESVLSALDALDHADEDVKRVQQLTARIRDGLNESCDKSLSLQRMSDDVAKKMMRIMKQAHGKPGKDKEQIKKRKDKPVENDEEQKGKASPPTSAAATSSASASSSCCSSVSAACQSACGVVVHSGITCDGCGMSPIRGVRFHCISCDQIASVREAGGYDLCETCEANAIHQKVNGKAHVMIKIKIPTKVIVDIEAPTGSLVGPHVYDVLRVNADGTRTPFRAAQPVIALPTPQATMAATVATAAGSSSKDEKKDEMNESVAHDSVKLADLESRILALESLLKSTEAVMKADATRKAEKQAEKEQKRKAKEERKKLKVAAAKAAKAARVEARQKRTEEKIAARAAATAAKKKADAEAEALRNVQQPESHAQPAQVQTAQAKAEDATHAQLNARMHAQIAAFSQSKSEVSEQHSHQDNSALIASSSNLNPSAPPVQTALPTVVPSPITATAATTSPVAAPAPAAAAAPVPAVPAPTTTSATTQPPPFAFGLPPFPFSTMVNSITSTVSSAFGSHHNNTKPNAIQIQPLNASASSSSSAPASSIPSQSVAPSSIWSSPVVSADVSLNQNRKRTLADVRAPAFFPYISQLRDLEAMGFDVDKSINALRYYRGDMQKAINSML